jgi:hypothetical protein
VGRILPLPLVAVVLLAGTMLASAALRRASRAPSAEESSAVMAGAREESASIAAATRLDTARLPAAPKASAAELRVARTWTKVRNRRSTTGEIEAVLLPGDTVAVDSLSRGWWRVALEGEVLGYVHQSTLVAEGSPAVQ